MLIVSCVPCLHGSESAMPGVKMQPQRRPASHRAAVQKRLLIAQAPKLSQDEQLEQLMDRISEYKGAMDIPWSLHFSLRSCNAPHLHQVM